MNVTKCLVCNDILAGTEKSDGICAICMARRIRVAVEQGSIDWDNLDHRTMAAMARRAVNRLNESGQVREAYAVFPGGKYPRIYARGVGGLLENVPMVFREETILDLITKQA